MIGILTDSTCDIPEPLIAQYGIKVIPNTIIWGQQQFRDRVDLLPEEFYRRLAVDPQRPTSSQASVAEFQMAYEEMASRGVKEIVALTLSSALSGAYQNALSAAKQFNLPVTVIDSKQVTMGLGWQVLAAARACAAGADRNDILAAVEEVRRQIRLFVAMDTLEYLQKGGRIGGAAKWVGGVLKIKPLVIVNPDTGLVEPVTAARTHKALVEALYSRFFDNLNAGKQLRVTVLHGGVPEQAEALAERIRAEYRPAELFIRLTGPVLGLHTGPGALALAGYAES